MSSRLGRARSTGPGSADAGMVTAEFAMTLPAFVLVVVTAVAGVVAVTDRVRCVDAAATAARLAARGEAPSTVRAAAMRIAPSGSSLQVTSTATTVTATVVVHVGGPHWLGRLPSITITQRSVAARESGVGEP
ncbi:MAG TPA: TadE family type IV pilus minor pilin [Mycobacteriales bacterium]|nr:TadE family type IV pilus minor pilin [Mycobacteriales bacterium]